MTKKELNKKVWSISAVRRTMIHPKKKEKSRKISAQNTRKKVKKRKRNKRKSLRKAKKVKYEIITFMCIIMCTCHRGKKEEKKEEES